MSGAVTAWARSAVVAALSVPARGWEADIWTVRGFAEVALGITLLEAPEAFAELDQALREARIPAGGPAADRLRRLRAMAGPIPAYYPEAIPLAPIRATREPARRAAALLVEFCDEVAKASSQRGAIRVDTSIPEDSPGQLRWGARYRPSPSGLDPAVAERTLPPGLLWRSWFRLPWPERPEFVVVERPARIPVVQRLVWRGIHDGAHLDHMAALAALSGTAPSPAEYGWGLAVAESYAMAVEIGATVACLLNGETAATSVLRKGLLERVARLTGPDITEFGALPELAEAYVVGPLRLLVGDSPGPLLPDALMGPLTRHWAALCAAFPPAAELTRAARELTPLPLSRS
ncbi:hypothetical protein [Actinomadura sp. DC4]|uniref:hypothetical protein n=1 Tax=Actinomadura sp. DC4 TaxID=3055069 RepID=UPI0025B193A5|nr:hypothetical protein [Actinomadura sp. DC4]MDN3353870.1 hypothetical protein [Actinomadura sp. DC4]